MQTRQKTAKTNQMLQNLKTKLDTYTKNQYRIPGVWEPEPTDIQCVMKIFISKLTAIANNEPVDFNQQAEYCVLYNSSYSIKGFNSFGSLFNLAVHYLDAEFIQYLFDMGAVADDDTFRVVTQQNADYKNIIQTLLRNGVNINAENGHTALYCNLRFHGERRELTDELSRNGASLKFFEHAQLKAGNTVDDAIAQVIFRHPC